MFDLSLDDGQQMVVDTARQFAARVLAPRAAALDVAGGFPRESLREAAELGLLGINVPEALGGVEAGAVAYALAVVELARACASKPRDHARVHRTGILVVLAHHAATCRTGYDLA